MTVFMRVLSKEIASELMEITFRDNDIEDNIEKKHIMKEGD